MGIKIFLGEPPANVKQMLIDAGVDKNITWNMPETN